MQGIKQSFLKFFELLPFQPNQNSIKTIAVVFVSQPVKDSTKC